MLDQFDPFSTLKLKKIRNTKKQFWALFRSLKAIQEVAENESMFPSKRMTKKKLADLMYDLAHAAAIDCADGKCPIQIKGAKLVQEILEPQPHKPKETPPRAVKKGPKQKGPKAFILTTQNIKTLKQHIKKCRTHNTTPQLPPYPPETHTGPYQKDPKTCKHLHRTMEGGCPTCGDPCL